MKLELIFFQKSIDIFRKVGDKNGISGALAGIGDAHLSQGNYDEAIKYFEESIAIARSLGSEMFISSIISRIARVYMSWGQYEKSIIFYEKALALNKKLGRQSEIAFTLTGMGAVYHLFGNNNKAINFYKESWKIYQKLGKNSSIANLLLKFGQIEHVRRRYSEAINYYELALEIQRKMDLKVDSAITLGEIGRAYHDLKQYDKSLKYSKEVLEIINQSGDKQNISSILNNLGDTYYAQGKYEKAILHFLDSIEIKERLRKTAKGEMRRDYLASQIFTYQSLILSYVKADDFYNALTAMEMSRSRLLIERLAKSETLIRLPTIKEVQKEIEANSILLNYAIVGDDVIWIALTHKEVHGGVIDSSQVFAPILSKYRPEILSSFAKEYGNLQIRTNSEEIYPYEFRRRNNFTLTEYFRILLTNPSQQNDDRAKEMGQTGYELLIKPLLKHITDKRKLIIIPTGELSYLPFETLVDENGKYLVENFDINYAPSIGILHHLKSRKYMKERKPLLALGGAVYEDFSYKLDEIQNEKQLAFLRNKTLRSIKNKEPIRDRYASLGIGNWANLPGSLAEVKAINKIVENSEIMTGREVTESNLKELSSKGELSKYKAIHFATHGLTVPLFPELSAIVLSQIKSDQENEDGYLRMGEIENLNLKADFVNLSACETGLGTYYGGEGLVGLTQSFFIAGANGLSVSLWKVADKSTMMFMVGVYQLVNQKGMSYSQAINEMKRAFIHGQVSMDTFDPSRGIKIVKSPDNISQKLSHPFYWAPFVYYGVN